LEADSAATPAVPRFKARVDAADPLEAPIIERFAGVTSWRREAEEDFDFELEFTLSFTSTGSIFRG
jgi:hypothetical protein